MDEVEAELRRIERSARREQMAAEEEALQLHLASRVLADVCREAMHRGTSLKVAWPGGALAGRPRSAVRDLLVLALESGQAAVNLHGVSEVSEGEKRSEWATTGDTDPGSFVAWCRMVEGSPVTVYTVAGHQVSGVLRAVASDHLLVQAGSRSTVVALAGAVAVRIEGDPLLGV